MGAGLLGRFSAGVVRCRLRRLGKRRRRAAFRAGSACETAQKFAGDFGDRIRPASSVGVSNLRQLLPFDPRGFGPADESRVVVGHLKCEAGACGVETVLALDGQRQFGLVAGQAQR